MRKNNPHFPRSGPGQTLPDIQSPHGASRAVWAFSLLTGLNMMPRSVRAERRTGPQGAAGGFLSLCPDFRPLRACGGPVAGLRALLLRLPADAGVFRNGPPVVFPWVSETCLKF